MYQGAAAKESDTSAKESTRTDRSSWFKRVPHPGVMHSKKPTSSVEADLIGGGSITYSHAHPKQEAFASSKNYTFKEGNRCKLYGVCYLCLRLSIYIRVNCIDGPCALY